MSEPSATPSPPSELAADHPNLQLARQRHRRVQWTWAVLFAGMAVLAFTTVGSRNPWSVATWAAAAILLAVWEQPALLAMVSILWGLSLAMLVPGLAAAFGGDPIAAVFPTGAIEVIAQAVIRVILAITAWNQFMLYRMLYGTARGSGLEGEPAIPEVIRDDSDRVGALAALLGGSSLAAGALAMLRGLGPVRVSTAQVAIAASLLAVGLGFGAAFSPTDRRGLALLGSGTGMVGFLLALAAGRLIVG
jgi:hypothetical protein